MQHREALSQRARIVTGERMGVKATLRVVYPPFVVDRCGLRKWRGEAGKHPERVDGRESPAWETNEEGSWSNHNHTKLVIPATERNLTFLKTKKEVNKARRWVGRWEEWGSQSEEQRDAPGKVPHLVLTQGDFLENFPFLHPASHLLGCKGMLRRYEGKVGTEHFGAGIEALGLPITGERIPPLGGAKPWNRFLTNSLKKELRVSIL